MPAYPRQWHTPEPLLSRTPLKREGRPGRSLYSDVIVRRRIKGILLFRGVLEALEKRVSSVLVFGNTALRDSCPKCVQRCIRK